jgi:6-phosphofructokinase 1
MIRLEKHDFESAEAVAKMAATVNMSPAQFRERFEYLVR